MTTFDPAYLFPLAAAYAETHYRFRFFPFSRYYRRQPEVIFDAPYRVEPSEPLPVTLIVKDADMFPIDLGEVVIRIGDQTDRYSLNRPMGCAFHYQTFYVDLTDIPPGTIRVEASLAYRRKGREFLVRADNHPGLSHRPLIVRVAEEPLPRIAGWKAGEMHCHTSYGQDQVEFGAPVPVIKDALKAIGLDFAAVTDHSYNLDDLPDNYLKRDPELAKWEMLQEESARLNSSGGPLILPGEELSCRNRRGRNVHLLIIGNREFLHGSGDGAEKWFWTRSEFSIKEALEQIAPETLAVAAHPLVPTPPLEWLLIKRGEWEPDDLSHPRLDGWQIGNGDWGIDFERGEALWKQTINKGNPVRLFGGNDAHGSLNRFRQVSLPMIRLVEADRNIFGRMTTRVRSDATNAAGLLRDMKRSPTVISDGPALAIDSDPTRGGKLAIEWLSTTEFGRVEKLRLFQIFEGRETETEPTQTTAAIGSLCGKIVAESRSGSVVRAELFTIQENGSRSRCVTSAVRIGS